LWQYNAESSAKLHQIQGEILHHAARKVIVFYQEAGVPRNMMEEVCDIQ